MVLRQPTISGDCCIIKLSRFPVANLRIEKYIYNGSAPEINEMLNC